MSVKSSKAIQARENSLKANPHSTYTLDGRVYNSEKYAGPLNVRKDVLTNMRHNDKVSASDIFNIERMLRGEKRTKITTKERESIIQKYDLEYDERSHRWMGDPVVIYDMILEQYPHAIKYKKYTGLLYAMKYGDTPCTTYGGKV